jgi:hypothetical protein
VYVLLGVQGDPAAVVSAVFPETADDAPPQSTVPAAFVSLRALLQSGSADVQRWLSCQPYTVRSYFSLLATGAV